MPPKQSISTLLIAESKHREIEPCGNFYIKELDTTSNLSQITKTNLNIFHYLWAVESLAGNAKFRWGLFLWDSQGVLAWLFEFHTFAYSEI